MLLAACVPPKPAPSPPTTPQGFDTCAAPSTATMQTWWTSSPYTSVGIYIGGANRGCAEPNLTPPWVSTVIAQGWRLLPIWVGPQAPCTTLGSTTKLSLEAPVCDFSGARRGHGRRRPRRRARLRLARSRLLRHGGVPAGRRLFEGRGSGVHERLDLRAEPSAAISPGTTAVCVRASSTRRRPSPPFRMC